MDMKYTIIKSHVRRIICQVEEESDTFHGTIFFEILFEESSSLHVDTHSTEHNREIVFVTIMDVFSGSKLLDQTSLTTDLSGNLL
jgi:hypothetical protein